ncbi:Omp28-related outer membrane protein [Flavobacterium macrobrachii]|jgi:hypothetical protein|uniref:Omp28-related outer membrane protein n=1 Tax=Flavobacterium macrobrachii TaxID=591204 RepID=UPI0037C165DA
MKKTIIQFSGVLIFMLLFSCTKTEDEVNQQQEITSIVLSSSQTNLAVGNSVTFTVNSNFGSNITDESEIFIDDQPILGNSYTFTQTGNYSIRASYLNFQSNTISITVNEESTALSQFVNRVLVEEYSGTWCGNCPRILYGTELLKEQTDKAVSVQIHLLGSDPFISPSGNSLASSQGVSGVPTGKINRTINWSGPQYQNVSQVINEIKPSSQVGLAINASLVSNALTVEVKMGFAETLNTKLVVYLVEDNLFHTQANYSSNLYGGLSSIPNFKYDGVLRSVVSNISGDVIVAGEEVQKIYSLNLPSNINNTNNIKIVAFLTNASNGNVLNVRESEIGQSQELEKLD